MTNGTEMIDGDSALVVFGPGSAFIDEATGDIYRLRDWAIDWKAEPFTGAKTRPNFTVHLASGMSTSQYGLPYPVRVVWRVAREEEADRG